MVMVPPCPDAGTTLTYANFGSAFMTTHCVECHGRVRVSRNIDLTSLAGVRANRVEIYSSAVATTVMPQMPPNPSSAERSQLGEWLSCGAP
jgi:hypothetical protein